MTFTVTGPIGTDTETKIEYNTVTAPPSPGSRRRDSSGVATGDLGLPLAVVLFFCFLQ